MSQPDALANGAVASGNPARAHPFLRLVGCPCDGMCAGCAGCVARLVPPGLVGRRQPCSGHAQQGLEPALPGRRVWQRALRPRCARCGRTAALGAERSSYKVDVAVVYIAQVNGLVKKAIERGALPRKLWTATGAAGLCLPFTWVAARSSISRCGVLVLSAVQHGARSPDGCTWPVGRMHTLPGVHE